MKILVTGAAGFIGSHVCEYYAKRGAAVIAFDNLSRARLLHKKKADTSYNWNYLSKFKNIHRVKGDIANAKLLERLASNVDAIIHTAGQTAVTTSVEDPKTDFNTNAIGALHVLEAARASKRKPAVVICSTNKVYGDRVNQIKLKKLKTRYDFENRYKFGVPEELGVDLCKHTPYGCSKLTADLYAQDYAKIYGLKVGVFRMSCIYGPRQFGVEDQGWLAWFIIAALTGKPITIYGDGKQVRDCLWVEDLVRAFDRFIKGREKHAVVNMGGGPKNTLSLLELVSMLQSFGLRLNLKRSIWRPSDQKVFISDIRKAKKILKWQPKVSTREGVSRLFHWVRSNLALFQ